MRLAGCALAALLWVRAGMAQHYTFSEITAGMDNLNVNCFVQDRGGYLWVGTENGLYRYDGRQFRRFGAADGLRGRTIQNLFLTPGGVILAGTSDGIYFQRPDGGFAEIHPPFQGNPFSQRIGTEFAALAADKIVAVGRTGAYLLRRLSATDWRAEAMPLEGGTIWGILAAPDGTLWYGCDTDLCRLAGGKTTHWGRALRLPADHWQRLLLARDGNIWVRSASHVGELMAGDGPGAKLRYVSHDFSNTSPAVPYDALAEDAEGRVIASQDAGFGIWEGDHWRMVTERNGLTRYDVSALLVDREGSIWLGVLGHGLMRWVGEDRWEAFTIAEGLSDDVVWASLRGRQGRLWVGTESGLDWIPPSGNVAQTWHSGDVMTARADSLAESDDGAIWMGSAAGSLARIDDRTLAGRSWKLPEVFRIVCDNAHRLWAATDGGLYVIDTAHPEGGPKLVLDPAFARPRMRFTDLVWNGKDTLWAASDAGLFRMNSQRWERIDPGLSGAIPNEIAEDREGNLWEAGAFPGILRLRIRGNRVVESQGFARPNLLSPEVVSLMVDHRGWLWVGQDAGITVFDGHTWRSFTRDDGLIWNDTDSNALNEDGDGSIWIGTSGGLSHMLHPQDIPALSPQEPGIAQIVFGQTAIKQGAQVPWSAQPLTVSIAALNFDQAQHIRIRYRLLGLEQDWVETAEENVRYARLDPGTYRFQAETMAAAGGAVSPIAEVEFRIAPRWWQSWILRAGAFLLMAAIVIVAWRRRLNLLMRQKQQLEMAVQRRTEDLEREKAELLHTREQMRHFAEHDGLTGLWNHRVIVDRLRAEVERSRRESAPVSAILADLDHFKVINDTYGHPCGDQVLRRVGEVFLHSVRSYDWVGRYGGEEFLLILPGTSFPHARTRAEELRRAVQAMQVMDGQTPLNITVSLGVASGYPREFEAMIRAADAALYAAKNNGRNCVMATEVEPDEAA